MGSHPWDVGRPHDDEPGHPAGRLYAKKKDGSRATGRDEAARATWHEQSRQLKASEFVFVDECGSNIRLTPVYAGAPKGQRAVGSVPRNRGANTTLIASLSLEGMGAAIC